MLYRTILSEAPDHPDACHNLGVLAMQTGHVAGALAHFRAALEAEPRRPQHWLSCIDALIVAGQADAAREMLALGRKQGLAGDAAASLASRLERSGRPDAKETDTLLALYSQGRHAEAETMARSQIRRFPTDGFAWKILGALLQRRDGGGAEVLDAKETAARLLPDDAEAHSNLANLMLARGRLGEAEAGYRRALRLRPGLVEAWTSLGDTLQRLGRADEGEASCRRAVELRPDYAEGWNQLGFALHSQGRLGEAETSYRRAIGIDASLLTAHGNLGAALMQQGRLAEAEISYRRVIAADHGFAAQHKNPAIELQNSCQPTGTRTLDQRALEPAPGLAGAHSNLGALLLGQGRLAEAEASCRRAVALAPALADAHSNLGTTLLGSGRPTGAEASYRTAIELAPGLAEAHSNLGALLLSQGRLAEAEASCRRAIAIDPDFSDAHSNLGSTLLETGRLAEAEASCRRALLLNPELTEAHNVLLFCLSHNPAVGSEALFAEHLQFGECVEAPLRVRPGRPAYTNLREPERQLRIGIVSADLYNHPVAFFLEPILDHLCRDSGFSLHAYSNRVSSSDDAVTLRLRRLFESWTPVIGVSDDAVADNIRADGIDILADLSGHTRGTRLPVFGRKPAPVQASWIGYPGTTGLQAMDYYLADRFFLPLEEFADQFTEKIVHLPATAAFLPAKSAPPVNPLPALNSGRLTLGSFNRLSKLSPQVVALWSRLLRALPDARMLLGAMPQEERCAALLACFEREGIARERLSLHPRCGLEDYLALHHQVDFCLDAFPYGGGTTNSHALWMGVPTLTLLGHTPPGRQGATIMAHVGLDAFIATDEGDFVAKGVRWAGQLGELAELRAGMRERFGRSPLGQPAVVAAGLSTALRTMWRRWCDGLPPEAF